jgi:hypothetical protein
MEALDLGLGLLQAHARAVFAVWALQLGLLLGLILPFTWRAPLWALLWLWWLKPWLDRGTLFVLSRAVFEQPAGLFDFLMSWKAVHRRGLVAGLLWRRLSPARSFLLPIFQLEGLGGAAYRTRASVLRRQGAGTAFLLTLMGLLFTLLTLVGSLGILQAMLPPGTHLNLFTLFTQSLPPWFTWVIFGLALLALTLTEPFFCAAGFALYLNRRTQLEGWDLELAFRRLAARLGAAVLLLALALPLRAQESPAPADPPAATAPAPPPQVPLHPMDEARQRALKVRSEDPAFRHTETVRRLKYRPTGREPKWLRAILDAIFGETKPQKVSPRQGPTFPKWLAELVAVVGKVVLVGALIAAVLWILVRYRNALGGRRVDPEAWEAPDAVAGLDIRPESLPPDVPSAARSLFARGEARAALALLYRGALAELVHRRGLEIPASATEGDCLQVAQGRLESVSFGTFERLTGAWQRLAYNAEAPDQETFELLCRAWPVAFGARP